MKKSNAALKTLPITESEGNLATLAIAPKRRGRPKGFKVNKAKKLGRPAGVKNAISTTTWAPKADKRNETEFFSTEELYRLSSIFSNLLIKRLRK